MVTANGAAADYNPSEAFEGEIFAKCVGANGQVYCKTGDAAHKAHLNELCMG